jgi:hypothetical protein
MEKAHWVVLVACLGLTPVAACADPSGSFNVVGDNPETGQQYSGTVTVTRTGETYSVVWSIAGVQSIGSGLGARFIANNRFRVGPANRDDVALSVGYLSSDDSFGIAMYFEQPDRSWKGVWTYKGSQKAISETWTRQ